MMEDWADIIGEGLESFEEPLPADDWGVLQQKYAASRRWKMAAAFAWAGGIAAAVALARLLVRPALPPVRPATDDLVAVAPMTDDSDDLLADAGSGSDDPDDFLDDVGSGSDDPVSMDTKPSSIPDMVTSVISDLSGEDDDSAQSVILEPIAVFDE